MFIIEPGNWDFFQVFEFDQKTPAFRDKPCKIVLVQDSEQTNKHMNKEKKSIHFETMVQYCHISILSWPWTTTDGEWGEDNSCLAYKATVKSTLVQVPARIFKHKWTPNLTDN